MTATTGAATASTASTITASRKRRRTWLGFAIALAALAALLGQFAYQRVLAQPDAPITFVVDGELPYGITQESVEAAAATHGALSYEPFTMQVVDRDLDWDEYANGELADGVDVVLSVGFDEEDPDLTLPSAARVGVAGGGFGADLHSETVAVREAFLNNLTMGHGPSAVVGAAQTAAETLHGGGNRNPWLWGSLAALPLLASLWLFVAYFKELRDERSRRGRFENARLKLARVVLELETLELRFATADAVLEDARGKRTKRQAEAARKQLQRDWNTIRKDSLDLARVEQALERDLVNPKAAVHSSVPKEPADLDQFERDVAALTRLAESLAASASVRVGHANSDTALARLALPTIQATGEVLRQRDRLPKREVAQLESQRTALLALVRESERVAGDDTSTDAVAAQAKLLEQWGKIEARMVKTLRRIFGESGGEAEREARARAKRRIRSVSAGKTDSQAELRRALGLDDSNERGPLIEAERGLVALEGRATVKSTKRREQGLVWLGVLGFVGPIAVALAAGGVAAYAQTERHPSYGQAMQGDRPLQNLQIYGDLDLLPDFEIEPLVTPATTSHESLTLENVNIWMERMTRNDDSRALLPTDIDLTVAILEVDEYLTDLTPLEDRDGYEIGYLDLVNAYEQIFADIAAEYPDVIDETTGEVRVGQAVQPIWVLDDGRYTFGLTLAGEISSGENSRLGAYYFSATELRSFQPQENDHPTAVGNYLAYELLEFGRTLEYNHLESVDENGGGVFWAVTLAVWSGLQTVLVLGGALLESLRSRQASAAARRQLAGIRGQLEKLALGLDLSRLDMVAVLGAREGERGDAAQVEQRLYETALVTAWRQASALESQPRRLQRGPEWEAQVEGLRQLVTTLAEHDTDVSERALEAIRAGE